MPKTKTPKEEVNTTERKNEKKNGNNIQIVYYVQLLLGIRVRIIGRRRTREEEEGLSS